MGHASPGFFLARDAALQRPSFLLWSAYRRRTPQRGVPT